MWPTEFRCLYTVELKDGELLTEMKVAFRKHLKKAAGV